MKGAFILAVFLLLAGSVQAVDCTGEFNDVVNSRTDVINAATLFELSVGRMYEEADFFYDELGDHENSDNLEDSQYEMESFLDAAEECEDDMDELKQSLEDYSDDIGRSRNDLPVGCFEQYTKFDDDHDDINRDFRDLEKDWDNFDDDIEQIRIMNENPDMNNVADAESKMRSIINDVDDFLSDVESLIETNVTVDDFEFYTELECIQMAEVTLANEKIRWEAENEAKCEPVNVTPTVCPPVEQNCSSEVINVRTDLVVCKGDLKELESKLAGMAQEDSNCDISVAQVEDLKRINQQLEDENKKLLESHIQMNGTLLQCQNKSCETDCGPWFWLFVALLILMILGWLLAM